MRGEERGVNPEEGRKPYSHKELAEVCGNLAKKRCGGVLRRD
jgi:hypothetical protein